MLILVLPRKFEKKIIFKFQAIFPPWKSFCGIPCTTILLSKSINSKMHLGKMQSLLLRSVVYLKNSIFSCITVT